MWFFSWVDWGDCNSIKFFGGEVVFCKVSDGTTVDTRSTLCTDPADFGQVGRVVVLEFFVKGQLAPELLDLLPEIIQLFIVD